ncbi:MAG: DUF1834 family protein [Caulobacter sp.]|nr:DUF1834 family protein [Caulobacter sp.]
MIIGAVENGIINRLEAASKADVLGYRLRAVETLPITFEAELAKYLAPQQLPAGWVTFGGFKVTAENGDGSVTVLARYSVVVAAGNLRNEKSQRHGAGSQVGSYQLVQDVAGLLMEQTFGLPISGLQLGECTSLFTASAQDDRKASLFMLGFTTSFELAPATPDLIATPGLGDFATFDVGWDLPPFTGAADVADLINLPQET